MNKLRLHGNTRWQVCPLRILQRYIGFAVYAHLKSLIKKEGGGGDKSTPDTVNENRERERDSYCLSQVLLSPVHVEKDTLHRPLEIKSNV